MARSISKEKRLTVRAPHELWAMLRHEETVAADDPATYLTQPKGSKWRPKQAQIAAMVLMNYASRSDAERRAILHDGAERLNALTEGREPKSSEKPNGPMRPIDGDRASGAPAPKKGRRA